LHAAGGVVSYGAGWATREVIRRIRNKIEEARSSEHRVMVSKGLAAALAAEHVFEMTNETDVLHAEFVHEPSSLAGRPITETSYTGIEPWIVPLNRLRKLVVVDRLMTNLRQATIASRSQVAPVRSTKASSTAGRPIIPAQPPGAVV
jgi:hypothetical protein